MSVHLVVISSQGPMGSALLMALIEKWGFSNAPIRKIGLPDYLLGDRDVSDPLIKERFREEFEKYSRPARRGGVSTLHWSESKALIDWEKVEPRIVEMEKRQYSGVKEIYDDYRTLFASATSYKDVRFIPGRHCELFIETSRFTAGNYAKCFTEAFDKVSFFHMSRDRTEWLETVASQYMFSPIRKTGFRLGQAADEYDRYLALIKSSPGIIIDLDELTSWSAEKLDSVISASLGTRASKEDLGDSKFDVASAILTFQEAFTKADKKGRYLCWFSRIWMTFLVRHKQFGHWRSLLFHPVYLLEMIRNRYVRRSF